MTEQNTQKSQGVNNTPPPVETAFVHAKDVFPLRAKPEFYRQVLYKILTKSHGQIEGFVQVDNLIEKIFQSQEKMLRRPLNAEEFRELRLRTLRDLRNSLLALSLAVVASRSTSETQTRRTRNLPFLQWRIEKEILALHWNCSLLAIDERQVQSGQRMSRFLADAIEMEGLN